MLSNKKIYKIVLFCFLIGIFTTLIIFQQKGDETTEIDSKKSEVITIPIEKTPVPKTSGSWVLTNITIDNDFPYKAGSMTWLNASTKGWCIGGGNPGNPYIIENVTIDGQGVRSCINITDSINIDFKINNCTLYNSGSGGNFAGIYLKGVTKGILTGNTISFCESGILANSSNNINIFDNIIYNASMNGIFLYGSGFANITDNTIFNSSSNGIEFMGVLNSVIENNTIHNINGNGIKSKDGTNTYDTIKKNKIFNNTETGIIFDSQNPSGQAIDIIDNEIKNNGHYGIHIISNSMSNISGNLIDHNGYSGTNKKGGICMDKSTSMANNVEENTISNNYIYGINVTSSNIIENEINNNIFINQLIHAIDESGHTNWDNSFSSIGNYWDDYWGKDFNDDGFGDTLYYLIGGIDHNPIWWDAPVISNLKPVQGTEYSTNAPEYQIQVDEGRGDFFWYQVIGIGTNLSYTELYGAIREKTSGTINQTLWDALPQGKISIRFYVNDTQGWITYLDVEVTKKLPISPITIIVGDDDDGGDGAEEDPYVWFIRAALAGAISASVGVVIKQSYSTVKRKRQLYELISKKLDEIEKLEQFLMKNLGKVDWETFKPVYNQYTKRKISQKDLIKEGKKSMGKSFTELFVPKSKRKFAR